MAQSSPKGRGEKQQKCRGGWEKHGSEAFPFSGSSIPSQKLEEGKKRRQKATQEAHVCSIKTSGEGPPSSTQIEKVPEVQEAKKSSQVGNGEGLNVLLVRKKGWMYTPAMKLPPFPGLV